MNAWDYCTALKDDIASILAVPGTNKVTVTLDPLDIPSGSRYGVVVISPPEMAFPAYTITDLDAVELLVIAGPAADIPAAWQTLAGIVDTLRLSNLPLATATPDMFTVQNGPALPGYVLRLRPDTLIDESETP